MTFSYLFYTGKLTFPCQLCFGKHVFSMRENVRYAPIVTSSAVSVPCWDFGYSCHKELSEYFSLEEKDGNFKRNRFQFSQGDPFIFVCFHLFS